MAAEENDYSMIAGEIPVVEYSNGERHVVGKAEVRATPDGLVAVVELNGEHSSAVESKTMTELGFSTPSLRSNPFDPAIFGIGVTPSGMRMLDEVDRNARAYGYEIGRGQKLAKYLDRVSPSNPFLTHLWRNKLSKEDG